MGFETQDVERKVISILKVLSDSGEPLGSRVIARYLKDHGIQLSNLHLLPNSCLFSREEGIQNPTGSIQ